MARISKGQIRRTLVRETLANCASEALEEFAEHAILDDGGYTPDGEILTEKEQAFVREWLRREASHFYRCILDDSSIP
jgi:hypothetical protein